MKSPRLPWLLLLCLPLVARAAATAAPVRVACIGDSIVYGLGLPDRATQAYPAQLQTLLGPGFEVRNFGNSGRGYFRHSWRGAEKRGFIFMPEHAAALAWEPDIVICNLGINDCGEYVKLWKDGACRPFYDDIVALLETYRQLPTRPQIYLWTKLAPLIPGQAFWQSAEPFLMQRELSAAARRLDAVGIDMQTPLAARHDLFPDKIHPNAEGARIIAETTHRAMKPFLDRTVPFALPAFCTSHAVLPAGRPFVLRGTANPGVRVTTPFGAVVAGRNGTWSVQVPGQAASWQGASWTFSTDAGGRIVLEDVVFGRVWLCAGQSNMLMSFAQCDGRMPATFDALAAKGALRLMPYRCRLGTNPGVWSQETVEAATRGPMFAGAWLRVTPANAGGLSALGVMFGEGLARQAPQAPVGIIELAVGGAPAEAFAPACVLARQHEILPVLAARLPADELDVYRPAWPKARMRQNLSGVPREARLAVPHPFAPETIWEGALAALGELPVEGVLWYQGESNASTALSATDDDPLPAPYIRQSLEIVVDALRLGDARRPILMVELVGKMNRPWAPYRAAQREIAAERNVALIPTDDLGDPNNVHPKDKAPIAERALKRVLPEALD